MLRIIGEGDGKFYLVDETARRVGWIHGRRIGFRGFSSETTARLGAIAVWDALDRSLAREYPGWPRREVRPERLMTSREGSGEWFHQEGIPVARLLRPLPRAFDSSFGIEVELPAFASEGAVIAAAFTAAAAVRTLGGDTMVGAGSFSDLGPGTPAA